MARIVSLISTILQTDQFTSRIFLATPALANQPISNSETVKSCCFFSLTRVSSNIEVPKLTFFVSANDCFCKISLHRFQIQRNFVEELLDKRSVESLNSSLLVSDL